MFAFDLTKAPAGTPHELYLDATMLHWPSLGVDPAIIAVNSKRVKDRFEPVDEDIRHEKPVAVVGYGPSLKDTVDELRKYRTVITCSGAHKFLLDQGIYPSFHVESEPRPHKVLMLGTPCAAVTYLLASIVHTNYFDALEAHNCLVKLWHILFEDEAYQHIPKGDWIITGGNTIGPRVIKIARLLGYTDIHVFGMDGCGKHAGNHTNELPDDQFFPVKLHGKTYHTTKNMLDHANLLLRDLHYIPDAKFTFHGDGLIQELTKGKDFPFVPGHPLAVVKDD